MMTEADPAERGASQLQPEFDDNADGVGGEEEEEAYSDGPYPGETTAQREEREAAQKRRALKEGEWACIDAKCSHINSEHRNTCEQCGKAKPRSKARIGREIGKDAAEKSKGLFAAEDWSCTKCGNINWARRTTCNICNAPKLGELEKRTGYGGGYMDREDVEYIERREDDEFDEFGRKKKRRRINADGTIEETDILPPVETKVAEPKVVVEKKPSTVEEAKEDEEDEDDDGDLGKYKLDDDDEEDDDDADLDKYDLTADPEVATMKLITTANKNGQTETNENSGGGADSPRSSSCSCSCSGGECSCEESDGENDVRKDSNKRADDRRRPSTEREHHHGNRRRSNSPPLPRRDRDRDIRRDSRERDRGRDRHSHHRRRDDRR